MEPHETNSKFLESGQSSAGSLRLFRSVATDAAAAIAGLWDPTLRTFWRSTEHRSSEESKIEGEAFFPTVTDGARMLCTVDHAHLHVLPTSVSVVHILEQYPSVPVEPGLAGLRQVAQTEEYVFYESPTGDRRLIHARDQRFESQYLRQVFAKALGHACEWNWRDHMRTADAHGTYEKIAASVVELYA